MVWPTKSTVIRIILYSTAGIAGYFTTKYFFPTREDQILREQRKARKEIEDRIIKDPKVLPDPIDDIPSGGFTPPNDPWIVRFFANERKYVIGGVFAVSLVAVTNRFHVVLGEILSEALPAIHALPVPLAKRLLLGFDKLNGKEILKTLKVGLLSNELSISEKASLVKKSVMHLLLSVRYGGTSRMLFISGMLGILSLVLTNGAILGGAFAILQDIFTKVGLRRATVEYMVEIYKEYNAPIPLELATLRQKVGSVS